MRKISPVNSDLNYKIIFMDIRLDQSKNSISHPHFSRALPPRGPQLRASLSLADGDREFRERLAPRKPSVAETSSNPVHKVRQT